MRLHGTISQKSLIFLVVCIPCIFSNNTTLTQQLSTLLTHIYHLMMIMVVYVQTCNGSCDWLKHAKTSWVFHLADSFQAFVSSRVVAIICTRDMTSDDRLTETISFLVLSRTMYVSRKWVEDHQRVLKLQTDICISFHPSATYSTSDDIVGK
jgi:hypothetical protein